MFKKKFKSPEINPDEIFLDSRNVQKFDVYQMEGKIEKSIGKKSFLGISFFFVLIASIFLVKIFYLQVINGESYYTRSENNRLKKVSILPDRGLIKDRNDEKLAWNELESRFYNNLVGLSHVLGYVGLPSEKDAGGNSDIILDSMIGKEGIEKVYDSVLFGNPGVKIIETDSQGSIVSESVQELPQKGDDVILTIDSKIQSQFFKIIESTAKDRGFSGGAGIILDVNNGEILSLVSYPEYDSNILSKGEPREKISQFILDEKKPFLNRVISGLYAPGSIIKPLIALAALSEGTISPEKQIFSAGYISLPNPFFPGQESIFRDWKAHGWVDMRRALAVSSDVYFYEIGGGYESIKGLGIRKIEDYTRMFGFNSVTGIDLKGEVEGVIPSPELKAKNNPSDPTWRIGDTYNASIGQGYFHVTPIEMAVYTTAIANNGKIVTPHLLKDNNKEIKTIEPTIPEKYFDIAKEGMRMAVTEGTASALSVYGVDIAAKTGTAEIGAGKKYVNSWVIGFFPYENPKYAFTLVMERGPYTNLVGAPFVMRQLVDWMSIYTPEYLK